jgi:hypothetical protein
VRLRNHVKYSFAAELRSYKLCSIVPRERATKGRAYDGGQAVLDRLLVSHLVNGRGKFDVRCTSGGGKCPMVEPLAMAFQRPAEQPSTRAEN